MIHKLFNSNSGLKINKISPTSHSFYSKFADDCGSAAQESKLVEKNNSNSRQFLTFVVVRKNRSVEEVNLSTFQNGVYKLFRTSPT